MFHIYFVTSLCLSAFVFISDASTVPFAKQCNVGDNVCLSESAQKTFPRIMAGIPELGVPTFNPLDLNDIDGDQGDLKLKLTNMQLYGVKSCNLLNFERPDRSKASIEMECPLRGVGHYKLGGKLLVIDVEGDGNFEVKTEKASVNITIFMKEVKSTDGNEYYKITSYDYKCVPIDRVYFKLDNLFNGDEAKAKPLLKFLNDNWEVAIKEMGKSITKEIIAKVVENIGKMLSAIPVKDIEKQ